MQLSGQKKEEGEKIKKKRIMQLYPMLKGYKVNFINIIRIKRK